MALAFYLAFAAIFSAALFMLLPWAGVVFALSAASFLVFKLVGTRSRRDAFRASFFWRQLKRFDIDRSVTGNILSTENGVGKVNEYSYYLKVTVTVDGLLVENTWMRDRKVLRVAWDQIGVARVITGVGKTDTVLLNFYPIGIDLVGEMSLPWSLSSSRYVPKQVGLQ